MTVFRMPENVREVDVKTLLMGMVLFLMVPALRAQQSETSGNPPQAATPPAHQSDNEQNSSPAIRQGHPLDPADVDVLTGKRDREMEAARQAQAMARVAAVGAYGDYGNYGDYFWMNGRLGTTWDMPMLPLAPVANPYFFSRISPRGFGLGGLRRGR